MIDTNNGATSFAIIYSIAETAKANNLKSYDYFESLLTELPKHADDLDRSFLEDLLLWSEKAYTKTEKAGLYRPCITAAPYLSRYRLLSVYF